ncbi:MAG: SH3 domain-containing protein [Spirochaetaceae bacterium]
MTRFAIAAMALAFLILPAGCDRPETIDDVELPTTPVLALRAGWAVAVSPYTPVVASPGFDAAIEGHLRRGAIVEVVGKTNYTVARDGEEHHWYQVRSAGVEGWIYGAELILTTSREQAVNASRGLTDP